MNARIKELAEQANLQVESWMTNPPKPFQIIGSVDNFDKFVELIINDCINIALSAASDTNFTHSAVTASDMRALSIALQIKQKFEIT